MRDLVVFCADVGSVRSGHFAWACGSPPERVAEDLDPSRPADLAQAVADRLHGNRPVALGFECPLFVPVPESDQMLGTARAGEGNRAWSAGAGPGALATGLVQVAWLLSKIRRESGEVPLHLDWDDFAETGRGLLIWEAFVSAGAKGRSHVEDATVAVDAFLASLPEPTAASAITAERPFSLVGAAAIWSGWADNPRLLHAPTLVIRG